MRKKENVNPEINHITPYFESNINWNPEIRDSDSSRNVKISVSKEWTKNNTHTHTHHCIYENRDNYL